MRAEESVNSLIRAYINTVLNIDNYAIRENQQNAPRPTGAYCSVNKISDTNVGWEQNIYTNRDDGQLDQNIQGFNELTYSLSFYRLNAIDNCRLARIALNRESIQQLFCSANVGILNRSPVRQITLALEDTFEERAQFDLSVNIVGEDSDIVQTIESALINYKVETCGDAYISTIEVN